MIARAVPALVAAALLVAGCGDDSPAKPRQERRIEHQLREFSGRGLRVSAYVAGRVRVRCPDVDPESRRFYDCAFSLRGRTGPPLRLPVRWDSERSRPAGLVGVVDLEHVADFAYATPGLKDALIERCAGPQLRLARVGERIACSVRRGSATGAAKPLELRVTDRAGHVAVVR